MLSTYCIALDTLLVLQEHLVLLHLHATVQSGTQDVHHLVKRGRLVHSRAPDHDARDPRGGAATDAAAASRGCCREAARTSRLRSSALARLRRQHPGSISKTSRRHLGSIPASSEQALTPQLSEHVVRNLRHYERWSVRWRYIAKMSPRMEGGISPRCRPRPH